jgi:hypothetical protein
LVRRWSGCCTSCPVVIYTTYIAHDSLGVPLRDAGGAFTIDQWLEIDSTTRSRHVTARVGRRVCFTCAVLLRRRMHDSMRVGSLRLRRRTDSNAASNRSPDKHFAAMLSLFGHHTISTDCKGRIENGWERKSSVWDDVSKPLAGARSVHSSVHGPLLAIPQNQMMTCDLPFRGRSLHTIFLPVAEHCSTLQSLVCYVESVFWKSCLMIPCTLAGRH